MAKHWFMDYISHCPGCSRQHEWAEAQYTPKPQKKEERTKFMLEYCDWCLKYS